MKNKLYISIGLIVGIVLVANLISQEFFFRLDFTENKQYTLNKATKDILKDLQEPVTIKAFFSENLPPNVASVKKDFKDLLIEYSNRSNGMLVYEFINPSENDEKEGEAIQNGIQPIMINVREKNEMKQQKAYLGAVIQFGEKKEIIPLIQPGSAMEYTLSKAIKKLTVNEKATVGLLQGHGEPSIQEIIQIYTELSVLYNVEPLTLSDTGSIPEHIKTIVIIKPKDTIPALHFAQMDAFLAKGGKMLIAAGRSNADLQKAYVSSFSNGLENWLNTKGIIIGNDIVIDAKCAQIQVQQQQGGLRYISTINFPYIPIISTFSKHSISGGLEAVIMQFPSSIEFTGAAGKTFTPIAFTSDKANTENLPLYFNAQKQWTDADFPRKKITIAGILEGNLSGNSPSKMVIIADGDFAINGERESAQQLQPDNVNFFVNSIDWLSDATGLIDLRTKSVTSRPIKEMEDSSKSILKYLNFLLPIILVIGYGFFKFQVNRNKRIKRMEESYV